MAVKEFALCFNGWRRQWADRIVQQNTNTRSWQRVSSKNKIDIQVITIKLKYVFKDLQRIQDNEEPERQEINMEIMLN